MHRLLGSMSGPKARLSSAASGTVFVNLAGTGFRLLVQIFLANWLGPTDYGRFVVARGWGGLLSRLPDRGYRLAVVRWLPHYERTGEADAYRGLVHQSVRSTLIASFVVTAAAIFVSILLLGGWSGPVTMGLTLIIVVSMMQMYRQILQASYRHVVGVTFTEFVHPALFGILAFAFALAVGRSVTASLFALVLAGGGVAILEALYVKRTLPVGSGTDSVDPVWREGTLPLFIGQLGNAGLEVSYLLIVGAILGPRAAGIYAVAQRIAVLGRMGNSAVESVIGPEFSRLSADGPAAAPQMQRVVDRGIAASSAFTAAACLVLLLGSDLALRAFGPEYTEGQSLLWLLLIGNLVNALSGPTGYLVSMTGSEKLWGYVMAGHAIVGATLAALVAWRWDSAIAVALVATAITISWNVWLIVIGGRKLGVWCVPRPVRFLLHIKANA